MKDYRKVRTVREFLTDLSGAEIGDRMRLCITRGGIRKTLYPILEKKSQTSLKFVDYESYILQKDVIENGKEKV